jgi:hypothetical protein
MIEYIKGDATIPTKYDKAFVNVIVHVNNDIGAWGKGFVVPLGIRFPEAKLAYHEWRDSCGRFNRMPLGAASIVGPLHKEDLGGDIYISNMVGQYGIKMRENGLPPVEYGAIESALMKTIELLPLTTKIIVHMPRIGCGLAGGKWEVIQGILERVYEKNNERIEKFIVYDL